MPIRVPTKTVIVQRNGQNFAPPVGKSFNFTAEEVAELEAFGDDFIRKPLNEELPASATAPTPAPTAPAPVAGKKGTPVAGNKGAEDL